MAKRVSKAASSDETTALTRVAMPTAPIITNLDEVIGQTPAKRVLKAAVQSGRVHHAWIFSGPSGVGKRTTARAFAAALLDPTTGPNLTGEFAPDPASTVQRLVRAGTHPDLHYIYKEHAVLSRDEKVRKGKQTTIAKEVLEEFLTEPATRTRVMIGDSLIGKAFIIDESELIAPVGQNTLLKTLEEPPAGTVIILITANEEKLLPTIRSRCQRVGFTSLDDAEFDAWLRISNLDIENTQRDWLRSFAAGSPGAARLAMSCDLFTWRVIVEPILTDIDNRKFDIEASARISDLVNDHAEAETKANANASKDGANKVWSRRMLAFIAEHYRRALRRHTGQSAYQGVDDPETARILAAIEAINDAEGYVATNVSTALIFENLLVQLASQHAGV